METQRIFEGKTVEHAIEEALKHFRCTREELEIEVITRGATGIFGIGWRKAKIRATHTPKKNEIHEAPQETSSGASDVGARHTLPLPMENEAMDESDNGDGPEVGSLPPGPVEPKKETRSTEKGAEGPKNGKGPEAEPFMEDALGILNDLLRLAHIEAMVEVRMDPQNGPYLNVEGQDLSLVIGKSGQNLVAFKYVTNLIMKKRHTDCPTIEVDAQGYLEKRRIQVESTARRMAEKARRTGRSLSLDPMNAKERRIVHLALKRIKGVTTKSVGEGDERRVLILPQRRKKGGQGRTSDGRNPRQGRYPGQSDSRSRRH